MRESAWYAKEHGALTRIRGEDVLVVDARLDVVHEEVHVLRRGKPRRLLVLVAVLPEVFVPKISAFS